MTRLIRLTVVAIVAAAVVAGCGGEETELHPGWDEPVAPDGPYEMEEAVVYLDDGFEQLVVARSSVDDGEPQLQVERHETGPAPVEVDVSADGDELYVLNAGDRPDEESLSIFEIDEDDVERRDLELPTFYDELIADPEGDFVLLANSGQADVVSQPLSQMGVVDLQGTEPEVRTVNLSRARAEDPQFLPPFELDGQTERLAVVTATNWISLVDLQADGQGPGDRSIPLTLSEADEIEPTDFVFQEPTVDNPGRASLFVLDDRSDDITQISLQPPVTADAEDAFDLSVNQLAAGDSPGAVEVVELEDVGQRLVALDDSSSEFSLVDIDSGETATFELPMATPPDGMYPYTRRVHDDGEEHLRSRLLVYSHQSELVAVIRPEAIAVGSDTPSLGDAVREIRLESTPSQIIVDDETQRAVVLHEGSEYAFSLVNLEYQRDLPWRGRNLSEVVIDEGVAYTRFDNSPHIGRADLVEESFEHFEIPDVPSQLFVRPGGDTVMVQHSGDAGRFSAVPEAAIADSQGGLFDDVRLFEQAFLWGLFERPVTEDDNDE